MKLLFNMNIYPKNVLKENAERLLNKIDPYNNKQITFSDCITLFSKESIEEVDQQGRKFSFNILDKISIDQSILK